MTFRLPYVYTRTVLATQAEVIQNHEHEHVRTIGHGEARHRKHKRLKNLAAVKHMTVQVTFCRLRRLATCFHAGILLGLFDPEDGGDMFLRNVKAYQSARLIIKSYTRNSNTPYAVLVLSARTSFTCLILVIFTLVISVALLCSRDQKEYNGTTSNKTGNSVRSANSNWNCEQTKLSPGSGNHGNTSQGLSLSCNLLLYKQN
jgi:hypothetical protein